MKKTLYAILFFLSIIVAIDFYAFAETESNTTSLREQYVNSYTKYQNSLNIYTDYKNLYDSTPSSNLKNTLRDVGRNLLINKVDTLIYFTKSLDLTINDTILRDADKSAVKDEFGRFLTDLKSYRERIESAVSYEELLSISLEVEDKSSQSIRVVRLYGLLLDMQTTSTLQKNLKKVLDDTNIQIDRLKTRGINVDEAQKKYKTSFSYYLQAVTFYNQAASGIGSLYAGELNVNVIYGLLHISITNLNSSLRAGREVVGELDSLNNSVK